MVGVQIYVLARKFTERTESELFPGPPQAFVSSDFTASGRLCKSAGSTVRQSDGLIIWFVIRRIVNVQFNQKT